MINTTIRVTVTVFILVAVVLLSLAVFDVLTFDSIGESLTKFGLVALLVVIATTAISFLNRK